MTLNIGPDPLATNPDDYDQILGGPAIPPAAFAPAALPRVQLGASTAAAPVLGGPAPIAPPSGPSSVLGGAAVPNPIMLPTPGTLTDPALLAAAQRAAMGRGPVVLPETTVEGRVPLPGMGGQAIASPSLKPQGGAALDASLAAVGKGAAGAVRAYKNETPGEALMRMQAQQAGERARLLTGNKGDIATSFANQELGITTETEALRAKAKEEADVAEDVKKRAAGADVAPEAPAHPQQQDAAGQGQPDDGQQLDRHHRHGDAQHHRGDKSPQDDFFTQVQGHPRRGQADDHGIVARQHDVDHQHLAKRPEAAFVE